MAKWYCPSDDYSCPYYRGTDGACLTDDPREDCDDYYYYNGDEEGDEY